MDRRLPIVTTTYYPDSHLGKKRLATAFYCMDSWIKYIKYENSLRLCISDDGSKLKINHNTRQERKGIGASLNAGFKEAFKYSDIAMYIVDDFMLHQEIFLNEWVSLLRNNEDIGMVRIGPPHPDLTGTVKLFKEGWALVLNKHNYAYSMRPALYHKRFFEAYGWFEEGISCWECERIYNEHFCASEGPEIVYYLPNQWEHIDVLPLGQIVPGGENEIN